MMLFANGMVVDGTGAPARQADVLVDGEKIRQVGRIESAPDMEVIDCSGLVVAPGFIDAHSHCDLEVLQHRSEKARQGVTSEVVGNCGFSLFPTLPKAGLADRGILAAGKWADLVVFSADEIGSRATYEEPELPPEGIRHVLVNGQWTLRDGELQERWPGKALRHRR